jgi:hypothetical protein
MSEYKGASRAALEALHAALLDALIEEFENGNRTAAFLGQIRAFLKDNGVMVDASASLDLRRSLAELRALGLPFVDTKKDIK